MIVLLPSRNLRRHYRGKYPTRVRQFGGRNGVYHFELNDGRRYVVTADEMTQNIFGGYCGREFIECCKPGATAGGTAEMSLSDYAAIILVGRILYNLRNRPPYGYWHLDTGFAVRAKL